MLNVGLRSGWKNLMVVILALGLLGSCSGGGGGDLAGGGISGTGVYNGVITSFGSVFVNGVEFSTTGAAITANNTGVTENDLDVGMKVRVEASGTNALSINFDPEVIGPVQSIDTVNDRIVVMGQTVLIQGTTILKGFGSILDLVEGNPLVVSGFFDAAGNIRAVFIELKPQTSGEEVKGLISAFDAVSRTFVINGLPVDYSGVTDPPQLQNGDFVEVRGGLSATTLVATYIELEEPVGTALPGNEMAVEGIVTSRTSVNDFEVNGLQVYTNASTVYENGLEGDVAVNVMVEVEGTVNDAGVLVAEKVEFLSHEKTEVGIEGIVEQVDPRNSAVTVFGIKITVNSSTIFNDESDRSFSFGNVQPGDLIEVDGFIDDGGRVVAVKVERINPSEPEYGLSGPVDAGSESDTAFFSILGVKVDVSGSSFEDENGKPITAGDFFALIDDTKDPGDIVDVSGGYQGGVFVADEVEIERIN